MFGLGIVPYGRRAASAHDIDQLFEQMSLRLEGLARRDLANVGVVGLAGAGETNPTRQSAGARPRLEWNFANIFEEKSLDEWNSFALYPNPVGTPALTDRSCGNFRFFHGVFSWHRRLIAQPNFTPIKFTGLISLPLRCGDEPISAN